jgi:aldose 1-epimerase
MHTRCLLLPLVALSCSAAEYEVERRTVDSVEVIILRDKPRGVEVSVAPAIGDMAFEMTVHGKPVFWSPYKTVGQFAARPTFLGNPFLWPWANRIDGTSYYVNGKKYNLNLDLGNVQAGPANTPIHGLVSFTSHWRVVTAEAGAGGAVLTSRLEFWRRPEWMEQFPFANNVEVTYRLKDGALQVETAVENLSSEPLPLSLGFHPYFRINDAPRDEWTVHLAARDRLELSSRLIPTGERTPNPYPDPAPLKGVSLDDVFDNLIRDHDGIARFWVAGKNEKITVEYGPKYTVAVVYSPVRSAFICFEPMTAVTNAFNAAHAGWYKGLQSVAPGQTWRESFWVRPTGF